MSGTNRCCKKTRKRHERTTAGAIKAKRPSPKRGANPTCPSFFFKLDVLHVDFGGRGLVPIKKLYSKRHERTAAPKKTNKQTNKTNKQTKVSDMSGQPLHIKKNRKGRWELWVFASFVFFMFFSLFFISTFPYIQKVKEKPKKKQKKNNPVRRIWSKSIPDCFFCFFGFSSFFSRFLLSQAPTVQKTSRRNPKKKNKKKLILWEESWVSPFRIVFFFVFFCLFGFFSKFLLSQAPNCPKTQGKTKKNKKKTIQWEESWVSPFRIVFFLVFCLVYLVFLKVFAVPKPNCPKTRGKTNVQKPREKPKKNNPVRRILGKSIQDFCFFGLFGFSRGFFAVPSPTVPKIGGNRIIFCGKEKICIYKYICMYKAFTEPIFQLST